MFNECLLCATVYVSAWVCTKFKRWSIHRASLHGVQDLVGEIDKPTNKSKQSSLVEELNSTIAARTESIVRLWIRTTIMP